MWNPHSRPPYEASWAQDAVPADDVAGTDRLIKVVAAAGEMVGSETVTVATPDFEASSALVATTWNVPGAAGAVYLPVESTVPPPLPSCTDQVTAGGCAAAGALPAVNDTEPFGGSEALAGLTVSEEPPGAPAQPAAARTRRIAVTRACISASAGDEIVSIGRRLAVAQLIERGEYQGKPYGGPRPDATAPVCARVGNDSVLLRTARP